MQYHWMLHPSRTPKATQQTQLAYSATARSVWSQMEPNTARWQCKPLCTQATCAPAGPGYGTKMHVMQSPLQPVSNVDMLPQRCFICPNQLALR